MLVTAQLMRFHCRIPQHYLVLLSLSGCVVFAASTSCLLDAAGLLCSAVAVLCARADGFAAAFMKVIGATRALLKALSELQIGALCNLQLCHHQSEPSLKIEFCHASCPNSSCIRLFGEIEVV